MEKDTAPQQPNGKNKLKSTCTLCAVAKVKCGRQKPMCARCEERGLECHYGPSQRSGRRPSRSPLLTSKKPGQQSTVNQPHTIPDPLSTPLTDITTSFSFGKDFPFNCDTSTMPRIIDASSTPGSMSSSKNLPLGTFEDYMTNFSLDSAGDSAAMQLIFDSTDSSGMCGITDYDFDMPISLESCSSEIYCPQRTQSGFNGISAFADTSNLKQRKKPAHERPQDSQSKDNTSSMANDTPWTSKDRSQGCFALVLELLTCLQTEPTVCIRDLSPTTDHDSYGFTPTISQVIYRNAAVLQHAEQILDCTCSSNGQQLLMIALLVSKVLVWYKTAAAHRNDGKGTTGTRSGSCSSTNDRGGADFGTDHVTSSLICKPATATSASYGGVECGYQNRMRAQRVLSELRHVVRAVDHWAKRYHDLRQIDSDMTGFTAAAQSHLGTAGGFSSGAIFTLIEAELRDSLRLVTRIAMGNLN